MLVVRKVQSHLLSPCFWPYFLLRISGRQRRTLRGTPRPRRLFRLVTGSVQHADWRLPQVAHTILLLLVEVRLRPVSSPRIISVFVVVGPGGYVAAIKAAQLGLKVLSAFCLRTISDSILIHGHVSP
jgi:hypothetical protein